MSKLCGPHTRKTRRFPPHSLGTINRHNYVNKSQEKVRSVK